MWRPSPGCSSSGACCSLKGTSGPNLDRWIWCTSCAELEHLQLHCFYGLTDLSPLSALVSLRSLSLRGCTSVRDLSPLTFLTALQNLNLAIDRQDFRIASLQQGDEVSGPMPAEGLDLTPLAGLAASLLQLGLSSRVTETADLSPLSTLTELEVLDLSSKSHVEQHRGTLDLTPLSTCVSLRNLDLKRVNCIGRWEGGCSLGVGGGRSVNLSAYFIPYSFVDLEEWDLRPLEPLSTLLRIFVKHRDGGVCLMWRRRERGNTWARWAWDDVIWVPEAPQPQECGAEYQLSSWWGNVVQTGESKLSFSSMWAESV